jgi:two-component system cell cycle response regulator
MSTPKILVVDKNQRFLEKTADTLRRAGYTMIAAENAGAAREAIVSQRPEMVLLNARLSGHGTPELCRFVKKQFDPAMPVVLLFARQQEHTTSIMVESGADNYLVRPLKRQELLYCVRDMIRIRRLQSEAERLRAEIETLRSAGEHPGNDLFYSFDVFKKLLYLEIKRAKRYNLPLSALLISLDGLDTVLATHGIEVVQDLREAVSQAIRASIRDQDLPVSFRQGHILIVMPHTDDTGARVVADRIHLRLRRSAYRGEGFVLRPTLSMGATTSNGGRTLSFGDMILTATMALREAQRGGGNRVVFA